MIWERVVQKILDASDGFHACESATSDDECKERFAVFRCAIRICLFQMGDKSIPQVDCIIERFHGYSALLQTRDIVEICRATQRAD